MLKLFKFMLAVIVLVILSHYYNLHKKERGSRELDKLDLIQEYLLNGESANSQKPILWIHNSYKINARNWDSFKSRNTKDLNQPYLYLCIKSIIKHCGKSFNVVLIDDNSFRKLIPDWNVSMNIITDPIENHMRNYALGKLLYYYGGMLVPCSTIAVTDFKPVYDRGVNRHGCFTVEKINRTSTSELKQYFPTMKIMGCKRKNPLIKEFVQYLEALALDGRSTTNEDDFLGQIDRWLYHKTATKKMTLIDGKTFGIKTMCGNPVYINDLISQKLIEFDKRFLVGIYIPAEELLKRTNYQWFARLSEKQALTADTLISRQLLVSLGNQIACN